MSSQAALTSVAGVRARVYGLSMWAVVVWVGAALYAGALSLESIADHEAFRTGVDTAIYDQLLWLLAHWHDPFSTVISRPMLGDHFQPGLVLFTPIYWLGLGVPGILTVQSIGLALTAPALFALARHSGASPRVASIPAMLWLACPWVASVNLFEFRPPAFAPVLLVLSVLAALRGRNGLLALTALLALSLKEDIALTYIVLGILLAYHGKRRVGGIVTAGAIVWFIVAGQMIGALGGSYDAFGRRFAGDRANSTGGALLWSLDHPVHTLSDIVSQSGPDLLVMFLSTGGLAILAPSWMLLALPTGAFNALSAYMPQHDLVFHYHLGTITGLFIAAAMGAGQLGSLARPARFALTGTISVALLVALIGGGWIHGFSDTIKLEKDPTERVLQRIPPDVPVAAVRSLLPHLTHRTEIYTLPEPFIPLDWGSSLTPQQLAERANRVRFVAYVKGDQVGTFFTGKNAKLVPDVRPTLVRDGFVVVARAGPVEIFERRPRSG
jgi:uncharacterized membrane protein